MPGRTLLYRLLVISPLFYVGAIAVRARLYLDPFVFTACTAKQQAAYTSYKDFYLMGTPFLTQSPDSLDREALRRAVAAWVAGSEDGSLQALTPVHLDDFVRDGMKQELSRCRDGLAMRLIAVASRELSGGDPGRAASDLIAALKLAEVMKYSDPYAVAHSGMMQRCILSDLEVVRTSLSPTQRLWLRGELQTLHAQQQPLEPMARLFSRLNRDTEFGSMPQMELGELDGLLRFPEKADAQSVAYLAALPGTSLSSNAKQSPYLALLRMSGRSQATWLRHLDQAIEGLSTPVAKIALAPQYPKRTHVAAITP